MPSEIREQITEWLTGADTCFLIGAGCSVCAQKPLIHDLTRQVLKNADEKLCQQFQRLKQTGDRPPTIEDLMTYLVRYRDILNTIDSDQGHKISIPEIEEWLTHIKKKIVETIADDWMPSAYHLRFLQRIRNPRQNQPRDVFSMNYDTVLEATLDELCFPYVDGFRGTNRAWFDSDVFDESGNFSPQFRIFKLHGSINWIRDDSGRVRRDRNAKVADEPIVLYPSEQKYFQMQYGVYENLIARFRNRLRTSGANNCLVVLGYSFNDEHINEAICDAVGARDNNLTVVSFIGPEADREKQIARLTEISDRCDYRFNGFIGNADSGTFLGHALDKVAADDIISSELWRFENLVDFIAKESV